MYSVVMSEAAKGRKRTFDPNKVLKMVVTAER
jgi:hypothetical protein